ncbi:MAG: hypothetical protein KC519_17895, partial [Anaerolineae bacterium]|nr:hypothetical protein [Anaerolineae bacterium]
MQPTFSLIPPKRVKTIISADKRLASMMISRVKKILAISLIALVGISTMLHLFFTFSDFCGYPMPSVSRYERGSSPTISVGNVQEIHNTLTLTGNERM